MKTIYFFGLLFLVFPFSGISQEKVIFEEHFTDNSRKWKEVDDNYKQTNVYHNKLLFSVKYPNLCELEWAPYDSLNIDKFSKFSIECETLWKNGENDWGYGLFWGDLNKYSVYFFEISSSGYYQFGIDKKGKDKKIIDWTPCDKINKKGSNKLMIKVPGNTIMLYVNNQFIRQIDYKFIKVDFVGFRVMGSQSIEFDDFIIKQQN